jgi:hypothetical protein
MTACGTMQTDWRVGAPLEQQPPRQQDRVSVANGEPAKGTGERQAVAHRNKRRASGKEDPTSTVEIRER